MIKWKVKKSHDGSNYYESECGRYRALNNGKEGGNKYQLQGKIGRDGIDYGLFCIIYLLEGTRKQVWEKANDIKKSSGCTGKDSKEGSDTYPINEPIKESVPARRQRST